MKLSEIYAINNCLNDIWDLNNTLPGPFEHVSNEIVNKIIYPQVAGIEATAKARASKSLAEGVEPDQAAVEKEMRALTEQLWDVDFPVSFPKIKAEWLPANVPKGTSAALEPIIDDARKPARSMVEKLLQQQSEQQGEPQKQK